MKSTRYTYNALAKDLPALNERLKLAGHHYALNSWRNGADLIIEKELIILDPSGELAETEELFSGTPKECLNACYEYVIKNTQPIGVK